MKNGKSALQSTFGPVLSLSPLSKSFSYREVRSCCLTKVLRVGSTGWYEALIAKAHVWSPVN